MPECRLLPTADADGPHNMAADEALLESAVAGFASVRFYGWTAPTLTLGYFQSAAVRHSGRLAELPWVRRPSGGAALVHHHEITYALALPAGFSCQRRCESWIRQMHRIIQVALAGCGIDSHLCTPPEARKVGEVLCFLHHTPDDLLIGTTKVAGSAQRKHRGAIVQHGGILLAASPGTLELPGIAELTAQRLSADQIRDGVVDALRREGWQLIADDWSPAEQRRIAELAAEKYTSARWNGKR
jgi:lipoate-protein ligase A